MLYKVLKRSLTMFIHKRSINFLQLKFVYKSKSCHFNEANQKIYQQTYNVSEIALI